MTPARGRAGLSFERMAIAMLFIALAFRALLMPAQNDTFWNLRDGMSILRTGHVPRADAYSFTAAGAPYTDHEWLSQVSPGARSPAGRDAGRRAGGRRGRAGRAGAGLPPDDRSAAHALRAAGARAVGRLVRLGAAPAGVLAAGAVGAGLAHRARALALAAAAVSVVGQRARRCGAGRTGSGRRHGRRARPLAPARRSRRRAARAGAGDRGAAVGAGDVVHAARRAVWFRTSC